MNRADTCTAIVTLRTHGKTPTAIAEDLGCSRQTVYQTVKWGTAKAQPKQKPKSKRTDKLINAVQDVIGERNGKATVKGLTWEFDVSRRTMGRLINNDLGLQSFKRTSRQGLKPMEMEKRMDRSKKLLNKLKHKPCDVILIFSDETPFSLGKMVSNESGFYLAEASGVVEDSTKHIAQERHFSNLQVLAVVGSDRQKCPLVFLESGERLTAATYCGYLERVVFPWARQTYGERWWWQQDDASCHTDKVMQEVLARETPGFFDKHLWLPHSPDLSLLDYAIFERLKGALSGIHFQTKD